jgi:hypothetical protein
MADHDVERVPRRLIERGSGRDGGYRRGRAWLRVSHEQGRPSERRVQGLDSDHQNRFSFLHVGIEEIVSDSGTGAVRTTSTGTTPSLSEQKTQLGLKSRSHPSS